MNGKAQINNGDFENWIIDEDITNIPCTVPTQWKIGDPCKRPCDYRIENKHNGSFALELNFSAAADCDLITSVGMSALTKLEGERYSEVSGWYHMNKDDQAKIFILYTDFPNSMFTKEIVYPIFIDEELNYTALDSIDLIGTGNYQQFEIDLLPYVSFSNRDNLFLLITANKIKSEWPYFTFGGNLLLDDIEVGSKNYENQKLQIFPNPVSDLLTIRRRLLLVNQQIKMYDIIGREITPTYSSTASDNVRIDLSDFPKGVYLLKTDTETFKVVKK